jgi:plasmid stabilization system protein ParE
LAQILWTEEAVEHLEAIVTYVSICDPAAAQRLGRRLIELANSLAEFPHRGRDAGNGRREMTVVRPYVLRYRVEGDDVLILRIRHGARDEMRGSCGPEEISVILSADALPVEGGCRIKSGMTEGVLKSWPAAWTGVSGEPGEPSFVTKRPIPGR